MVKIEISNLLKISSRFGVIDFLKGLKKGEEFTAKIIDRPNNKEAVLEIGGKRIRAEFLGGVPKDNRLILKLEDNKDNSYIFKIINNSDKNDYIEKILKYTIFSAENIDKTRLYSLSKYLDKNLLSIYELHAYILNINEKQNKADESIKSILNKLIKYGISMDKLIDLSFFLSRIKGNGAFIFPILMLFGYKQNDLKKWSSFDKNTLEDKIDDIIHEVDNLNSEEKNNIILELIKLLSLKKSFNKDTWGELVYFDDNEFKEIKYIYNFNSWIFFIEFSNLGTIEILLKKTVDEIDISIFTDNNDVLKELKDSLHILYSKFDSSGLKIYINMYTKKSIIEKIVEIISYSGNNSAIDIKV